MISGRRVVRSTELYLCGRAFPEGAWLTLSLYKRPNRWGGGNFRPILTGMVGGQESGRRYTLVSRLDSIFLEKKLAVKIIEIYLLFLTFFLLGNQKARRPARFCFKITGTTMSIINLDGDKELNLRFDITVESDISQFRPYNLESSFIYLADSRANEKKNF